MDEEQKLRMLEMMQGAAGEFQGQDQSPFFSRMNRAKVVGREIPSEFAHLGMEPTMEHSLRMPGMGHLSQQDRRQMQREKLAAAQERQAAKAAKKAEMEALWEDEIRKNSMFAINAPGTEPEGYRPIPETFSKKWGMPGLINTRKLSPEAMDYLSKRLYDKGDLPAAYYQREEYLRNRQPDTE